MASILIIEDQTEIRENIAEILELEGYETHTASDGKLGVSKAMEVAPDLILCDVMMPGLDGFGVLKILQGKPELATTPFIFLTAKTEKADFRKGMVLGADDYITKPFDDAELLEAIRIRLAKAVSRGPKGQAAGQHQISSFIQEDAGRQAFETLCSGKEIRLYNKKDLIYKEGMHIRWLYRIMDGMVKVYHTNDMGKEWIAHLLGPEDLLGVEDGIADTIYSCNAAALTDTRIQLIPVDAFVQFVHTDRNYASGFMKALATRNMLIEQKMTDLAYGSVRRKVANALLYVCEVNGSNSIELLREDLANIAGVAKETFIRTLTDFKGEGLVAAEDGSIHVVDLAKLAALPY